MEIKTYENNVRIVIGGIEERRRKKKIIIIETLRKSKALERSLPPYGDFYLLEGERNVFHLMDFSR